MEADPRPAEIIIKQLELEDALPLALPKERLNPKHLTDDDVKELNGQDASIYSAIVARGIISLSIGVTLGMGRSS